MITPKTHFILQHDHGYADNVIMANQATGQAQWFGVNTHLYQDVLHDLSIGVRGEWFRDRDGFRVWQPGRVSAGINGMDLSSLHSFPVHGASGSLASSQAADYYAITIGANWKPAKRLKIDTKALQQFNVRPNIRYDRADSLTQAAYRPFGGQKDQVLFSMDFTLPF